MSHSTAITYTIIAASSWVAALGCWVVTFFLWATNNFHPNATSIAIAIIGLLFFIASWTLAAKFHAASTKQTPARPLPTTGP